MRPAPFWRRYLRFWGTDIDADVQDELRFHLESRIGDYLSQGLSRDEAERAAHARFGDAKATGQALRVYDRARYARAARRERFDLAVSQLRTSARSLRRTPGFALTAILALALGIGMSTAVFTIADTLLLAPLPVRDEARLLVLWARTRDGTVPNFPLAPEEARGFVRDSRAFEQAAYFAYQGAIPQSLVDGDHTLALHQSQVSGDFFAVLGMRAAVGRLLQASDDVRGAAPVAVLSFDAWQRDFAGDPNVLGRRLLAFSRGITYTIVGVAARGLDFPRRTQLWVPVATSLLPGEERFFGVDVIGRVAAGRTFEQGRDALSQFLQRPEAPLEQRQLTAVAEPLRRVVLGDTRPAVLAFAAAVVILLLITCINVAALLLVRALLRTQELAVRTALGASRRHLVGVLLSEAVLLAAVGGLLGVGVCAASLKLFASFAPPDLPRMSEIRFDGVAVLIAIGVTTLTLLGFGLFPALRHSRVDATEVLRGGPGQSTGRSSRRAMEWLVRGQIALAALILCDAALVGESLLRLQRADLAFAPEHVMVAELALQAGAFDSLPKQIELLDRLVPALAAIPGVVEASPVVAAPFSGAFGWDARLAVEGETPEEAQRRLMLNVDVVDTGYFHALGIATLEGRTFSGTDRENALPVVVLSRSAARQYWPGKAPLGQRVALDARGGRWFTVVGIVADTRYRDLREPRASVYFPLHQSPFPFAPTTLAIRTAGAPEFMVPTIRRTIQSSAAGVTVARAEPMSVLLRAPLVQPRLNTLLLMLFATAAVTLAAVGLFGVMATMVRQRTKEIAIRVAIGATPGSVRAMILRQGVGVAAVGTIAGCLLAFATIPALGDLLYGSSATNAVISAAVIAVVLGVIAAAATLAPAIYATRVDPAAALRVDA